MQSFLKFSEIFFSGKNVVVIATPEVTKKRKFSINKTNAVAECERDDEVEDCHFIYFVILLFQFLNPIHLSTILLSAISHFRHSGL